MKYYVQVQWCRPSSKCYIGHASEDDEQFDGDNFVEVRTDSSFVFMMI